MKKLLYILTLVAFMGISANSIAQGTGVQPEIGSLHTYTVTEHGSNAYTWTLTTEVDGVGTDLIGSVATGSSTTHSIALTWINPATDGTVYYLHVVESDGTCSNHKALAIRPANAFSLQIASVDLTDANTDNGATASVCAPSASVTAYTGTIDGTAAESQEFTYDYDATVLYYKITASGITNTQWRPVFTVGHNSTNTTVTAEWAPTSISGTYTALTNVDGATGNDILVNAGVSEIWVKVTIDNGDSLTGNEGTTSHTATVTLLNGAGESRDVNGNLAVGVGVGTRIQTVNARPATSVISF